MKPHKLFLCGRNLAKTATITSDDAAPIATMPLSNLQRSDREYVWRQSSDADVSILVSFESGLSDRVNFVVLARHNFEGGEKWRIRGFASYDGTGSPIYDSLQSPALEPYNPATLGDLDWGVEELGASDSAFINQRLAVHYFVENADVINSLIIDIYDAPNSSGYHEASYLYIGRGIEMLLDAAQATLTWEANTEHTRTDGGSLQSDGSISWRDMELRCLIDSTQRAQLMDVFRISRGGLEDCFIALNPDADDGSVEGAELHRDYTFIGRFKNKPAVQVNPDQIQAGVYETSMEFTEI